MRRITLSLGLFGLLFFMAPAVSCGSGADNPRRPVPTAQAPTMQAAENAARVAYLTDTADRLKPLHKKMGPVFDGDWLTMHEEPGQTFQKYLTSDPVLPEGKRRTLYILPIGEFDSEEKHIMALVDTFMGMFFGLPMRTLEGVPLNPPIEVTRVLIHNEERQVWTTYLLRDVLMPRLPDDAAALLGFTTTDIWPGKGWNYVFGMATWKDRVGIWSLNRFGDPGAGLDEYRLVLRRTLKLSAHETGHTFGIKHCTAYECLMCGTNNLNETDRRPMALCPECLAKLCWATGADPVERYDKLAEFCLQHKLAEEAEFFERSKKALTAEKPPSGQ